MNKEKEIIKVLIHHFKANLAMHNRIKTKYIKLHHAVSV